MYWSTIKSLVFISTCTAERTSRSLALKVLANFRERFLLVGPGSGHCYLNKGECNLNQSKDDSFVERVAKNNS